MLLADRSEGLLVGSLLPVPRQCETLIAAGLASQHKSRVCPPICSRCQTLGWRKEIKLRGNVYSTTPPHQTLSGEGVHRSEVVNIIGCWQKRCAFIPGRGEHPSVDVWAKLCDHRSASSEHGCQYAADLWTAIESTIFSRQMLGDVPEQTKLVENLGCNSGGGPCPMLCLYPG